MELRPLGDIAEITSPLTFRGEFVQSQNGNVRLLTIKDLVSMNPIDVKALSLVQAAKPASRINIADQDVLMPARGQNYPARMVTNVLETILPTGQVHIIRTRLIDPQYLVWFLNRKPTQAQIAHRLTGSTIQSLTKKELIKLEIGVPSLEIQKMIGELNLLRLQREIARKELQNIEDREIDDICEFAVKGHSL